MLEFSGIYAKLLRQYIEFKRNLGYRYSSEYRYREFDRFTIQHGCTSIGLTKELIELWGGKRPNETDSNRYRRIIEIGNFSKYLNSIGFQSFVPQYVGNYRGHHVPYIFSQDEIKNIFLACDNLPITGYSNLALVLPALFRLIYGCGLRVNEALSLKCSDVNIKEHFIVIRDSKNGTDRVLPFTNSVSRALDTYTVYRSNLNISSDYFFVKKSGDRCTSGAVYDWFRVILLNAGIPHRGRGYGPRLHDLRHSFSVHSLASMSDQGLDLYYSLPILSKYLGHRSLESTDKYVRLTEDMYPGILKEVDKLCAYIFPEVHRDETE